MRVGRDRKDTNVVWKVVYVLYCVVLYCCCVVLCDVLCDVVLLLWWKDGMKFERRRMITTTIMISRSRMRMRMRRRL